MDFCVQNWEETIAQFKINFEDRIALLVIIERI